MTYGEQIMLARRAKNMKQSEVARLSGVNVNTISSWERNETTRPDINLLIKVALVLEMHELDILKGHA
jgi:transcriptional regulator with XRE-family HTH domain